MQNAGTVTLMLVCLDEWKFEMSGGPTKTHFSSPNPNANQSLYVGDVQIAELDKFWEIFETLLLGVK